LEIVWTEAADRDVALAFDYLQGRSRRAARAFLRRIFAAVDDLERMPHLGKVCELELSREYRALVVGYHKVFYAIDSERDRIIIARVWDTRQDPTRLSLPRT
jgi:plasmid stabilization system protein ParE